MKVRNAECVQRWFIEEKSGSLMLPDGWFGRPFDNQHELTSLVESNSDLTIILDGNLTLYFYGLESVETRKKELVFSRFHNLRFEWQDAGGSGEGHSAEFGAGEVKIVSAPG